ATTTRSRSLGGAIFFLTPTFLTPMMLQDLAAKPSFPIDNSGSPRSRLSHWTRVPAPGGPFFPASRLQNARGKWTAPSLERLAPGECNTKERHIRKSGAVSVSLKTRVTLAALALSLLAAPMAAQELEPRAYSPSPTGTNFVVVG